MTDPNSAPQSEPPPEAATPVLKRGMLWFFGLGTVVAGLGFIFKIFQFTADLLGANGIQFASVHLLTYSLVAGGFLSLLVFGFLCGHFSNIEQPKLDLLDEERRHDRAEFA